jgi:hypothetical protein
VNLKAGVYLQNSRIFESLIDSDCQATLKQHRQKGSFALQAGRHRTGIKSIEDPGVLARYIERKSLAGFRTKAMQTQRKPRLRFRMNSDKRPGMKAAPSELTTFYKPKIRILACRLCSHIL